MIHVMCSRRWVLILLVVSFHLQCITTSVKATKEDHRGTNVDCKKKSAEQDCQMKETNQRCEIKKDFFHDSEDENDDSEGVCRCPISQYSSGMYEVKVRSYQVEKNCVLEEGSFCITSKGEDREKDTFFNVGCQNGFKCRQILNKTRSEDKFFHHVGHGVCTKSKAPRRQFSIGLTKTILIILYFVGTCNF